MTRYDPATAETVASTLARAKNEGLTVVPRGAGTKLAWAARSARVDAEICTLGLNGPVSHFAGDLVATIPAGVSLTAANAILADSGQWLPLDPSFGDRATIGGIVAANDSGPRRHRFGTPRDLIIGIEVALADGRLARAGGRVVKNVAGYDLSRLFCGSLGALGIITSATFKLAPRPAASRTVIAEIASSRRAIELAMAIATEPLTPSAIEIEAPGSRVLLRFESTQHAAERMAVAASSILHDAGVRTVIVKDDEERAAWTDHAAFGWVANALTLKVSVLPTDLAAVLAVLEEADRPVTWRMAGRAALGVAILSVDGPAEALRPALTRLCAAILQRSGYISVLEGPAPLRIVFEACRPGAPAGPLSALTQRVKSQFDPGGVLAVQV